MLWFISINIPLNIKKVIQVATYMYLSGYEEKIIPKYLRMHNLENL